MRFGLPKVQFTAGLIGASSSPLSAGDGISPPQAASSNGNPASRAIWRRFKVFRVGRVDGFITHAPCKIGWTAGLSAEAREKLRLARKTVLAPHLGDAHAIGLVPAGAAEALGVDVVGHRAPVLRVLEGAPVADGDPLAVRIA